MEQLILNIKDTSKLPFLIELLSYLDFVEVQPYSNFTARQKEILADLEQSVKEINLHKEGKIELKPIQQLLDELE